MLEHIANQWLGECLALFFTPFLHEDVAIVMAGMFVTEHGLPWPVAAGCVYVGMVLSDVAIFALGRGARRLPKIRDWVISDKVEKARKRLHDNIFLSVALCRIFPGILFPTFTACGWVGVRFSRFLFASAVAGAVYLTVMFVLVLTLGQTIVQRLGWWAWIVLLGLIVCLGACGLLRSVWGLMRVGHRGTGSGTPGGAAEEETEEETDAGVSTTHRGMPPLSRLKRHVSLSERIPPLVFYVPLALRWLALGVRYRCMTLPTVANPNIELGGLWGESKSRCMRQVSEDQSRWIAPFATVVRNSNGAGPEPDIQQALDAMAGAGLSFPVVAKPDVGWQGYGTRVLASEEDLREYVPRFPNNETFILQQPVPYDGEAGVFYIRMPGEEKGRVTAMTLRYFPFVVGDGASTVRELIARDRRTRFKSQFILGADALHRGVKPELLARVPAAGEVVRLSFIGSIRVGGLYRDGTRYITPELSQRFDELARSMPDFHFGRFDIRFRSLEELQKGEGFAIFEINGAGSEAIQMWDPERSLRQAYHELFVYQSLLFEIGHRNRQRGFRPATVREFFAYTRRQNRLVVQYPPSD